jgi:penicillin-binding protein 1A
VPRQRPHKPRKTGKRKKARDYGVIILWGLAFFCVTALYFFYDLPNINEVRPLDTRPSIAILADDGTLITRYGGLQGETAKMRDVPSYLIAAVLSVEDRRFYSHFGIDPLGLARAMFHNILAGHWVQGGSTITQQLAKNLFLTPDKTLRRKVQEAVMALEIEHKYSKDEILLAYLNRVYFGAGAYGVDAASRTYFGKPSSRLTLFESAVLAGLLKAPSRYSPATAPDLAVARAKTVIETMKEAGYINAHKAAQEIKNAHIDGVRALAGDLNHYFTDWVIEQADSFIESTDSDITIKTTLDPKLQLMAESRLKALFKKIPPEDKVTQGALVTQSPDGAVRAMIGGVDYAASQFNRATQALRQPGSAFKPFVYLAALEAGMDPDTQVEDARITDGSYRPDNYDNKYYGTVTLTEALAHSMNTATVRVLQQIGIGRLMDVAERMGFVHMPKPELSAGLGADETTLLELTNAYAIIANGGLAVWPYTVLSIKDGGGNLLYQRDEQEQPRVFAAKDINALNSMLEAATAPGSTGQAARLSSARAAGKTGTTQNYRDAWFMGYAGKFITGVWMGNDDATPMRGVTGGRYPAQLWHDDMEAAVTFDVPVFVPEELPSAVPEDSEFSSRLNRWQGSTAPPVYNR